MIYVAPQKPREHEKVYLEPLFTDTRYISGRKTKSRFTLDEVEVAGNSFRSLAGDLVHFRTRMRELEARLQALV